MILGHGIQCSQVVRNPGSFTLRATLRQPHLKTRMSAYFSPVSDSPVILGDAAAAAEDLQNC